MILGRRSGAVLAFAAVVTLTAAAAAREHGRMRPSASIVAIVIHAVGGPSCIGGAVRFRPVLEREDAAFWHNVLIGAPRNDAHFVIGRTGIRLPVIPAAEIANHTVGLNDISIGIELVNRGDGREPFTDAQIASLIELIKEIRSQYPAIPIQNIVAHSDIDQRTCSCNAITYRRRQDPGANFPMAKVIEAVRRPGEGDADQTLPYLTGAAHGFACRVEPR